MCVPTNFDGTVRRELLHRGSKFDIETLCFTGNRGETLKRECIRHPGSVIVLPLLPDGRVVLIRNWRLSTESWIWELPAGTMTKGEPPKTCAKRELSEETGFAAASVAPLPGLPRFYPAPGLTDELMHAFVATDLTPLQQRLEDDERIEVHPVPVQVLEQMIVNGDIIDAKTLLVWFTWKRSPRSS